eukprot:5084638-Pyramimonas_sp.AAC.3
MGACCGGGGRYRRIQFSTAHSAVSLSALPPCACTVFLWGVSAARQAPSRCGQHQQAPVPRSAAHTCLLASCKMTASAWAVCFL